LWGEQAGRREADGLAQERQLEQLTSWVRSCEDLQEDLAAARKRSAGLEVQVAALREENMSLAGQLADAQDAHEKAVTAKEHSSRVLEAIQANLAALQVGCGAGGQTCRALHANKAEFVSYGMLP
jgi:septal ring factor EnvC (AmiA/AmiB activator)